MSNHIAEINHYIAATPDWQQQIMHRLRGMVHQAGKVNESIMGRTVCFRKRTSGYLDV